METIKIGKVVTLKGHTHKNGRKFSGIVIRKDDEGFTVSTNNRRSTIRVNYGTCEIL